jgi:hypothetical protein
VYINIYINGRRRERNGSGIEEVGVEGYTKRSIWGFEEF